jgi:hypothetical protein
VETRLRQLEGKAGGRVSIGNKSASKYDAERKPDAPALLTAAKVGPHCVPDFCRPDLRMVDRIAQQQSHPLSATRQEPRVSSFCRP